MALELAQLERLAMVLTGRSVTVRFEDLRFMGAWGATTRADDGAQEILIDERLESDPDELSFTFYHEAGHIARDDRNANDADERLADGFATLAGVRIGRTAPWRMVQPSTTEAEREHILSLASKHAASATKRTSGVPYTAAKLAEEYRSGALLKARQTQRGTVESMIARSLGLNHGEGDGPEWATVGGYVRAATRQPVRAAARR